MKTKITKIPILTLLLLFFMKIAVAQTGTPQFFTNVGTGGNAFPLSITAASPHTQFVYAAGEFTGANPGMITHIYLMPTAAVTSMSFNNFSVSMVQVPSMTVFSSGTFLTGLTTCIPAGPKTFTSIAALGWIKIALTTPFLYDPSKALIVDIMHSAAGTGTNVSGAGGAGTGGNKRIYGAYLSTAGTAGTTYLNMGIDVSPASSNDAGVVSINSPGLFCSAGTYPVTATIRNMGINQITSVNVNWSINGTAQTPISYTSVLDTFGTVGNTANVTLGTYAFPATTTNIKVWTSLPNSTADTVPGNDTAYSAVAAAMGGNFTINPNGSGPSNFTSFASAISAMMANGICAPVNFNVAPGVYSNQVVVPNVVGASPVNTITFNGVNPDSCTITGSYAAQATVILNGSKYVTFKNFKVENTSAGNCAGIALVGSTNRVTIYNNRVFVPIQTGTSSSGYGIVATGTANGGGISAMSGDSIVYDSNIVTGGAYSLVIYGATNAASNRGIIIRNNITYNSNYMGGYIAYNYNPMVFTNNVFNLAGQNYGYYGLYFYSNQSSHATIPHIFTGNKVNNFSYYGIYMYLPLASSTAAPMKIYNNVIQSMVSGYTPSYYGWYLQMPAGGIAEFYHNTIVMNNSSAAAASSCMYQTGSAVVKFKNNVFYLVGSAGTPFYTATAILGNNVNYNNYYNATSPTTGNLVYNGGNWTSATYRTNVRGGDSSYNVNPAFAQRLPVAGNLSLTDGCDGYGVDLTALVPTDVNGAPRAITPNPGAYEYSGGFSNNLKVVSILAPFIPVTAGTQDLRFLVKNIGSNSVSTYDATYKNNSGLPVTISKTVTMGLCAADTAIFTGANQITIGSVNQITVYTANPNATTDPDRGNDTLRTALYTPLNGTYTVGGTTPDFPNPAAAAAALQYGVSGPVTFDVRPGTYLGQVIVNGPIVGSSTFNRVTFEGNDNTTRVVTADVVGSAFLINQANNVTVQNLRIINTNPGNVTGFGVVGTTTNSNGSNITIRKCDVRVPIQSGTSSSGYGICFTGTAGGNGVAAMRCDSSIIDSNMVTGSAYGIVHYGATNAAYNRGIKIRGNDVKNANYMGGYIAYNYNPMEIIGNKFNVQGQNYGYYGLYFYSNQNGSTTIPHLFIGNTITNFSYYGIYLYLPNLSATTAPFQFYNNTLNSVPNGYTLSQYGVYFQMPAGGLANVYHNTSVMNTSAASAAASPFYSTGSAVINVKNNIFALYSGAGTPFYAVTTITGNSLNYNNYYNATTPLTSPLVYNGGSWTAATYLTNTRGGDTSYNYNPVFTSRLPMPGDLHLTSACAQRGFDLTSFVPTDIDNQLRNIPPQIGSDENASGSIDMAVDALLSPSFPIDSGLQNVVVRVRNNGSTAITSMNISYKLNSLAAVTQPWSGTLSPCDTVTIIFSGIQQVNIPFNANNTFKVYTSNPNSTVDVNNLNDTLSTILATPLNGNYTIGPVASTYPSFTAAMNAIQSRGVSGPVTFNVRTATYAESFIVPLAVGSSLTNTITFKSLANNADSVIIAPPTTDGYIARFESTANTIFRKITFRSNAVSSTQNGIVVTGVISNDTIIDCKIIMEPYASSNLSYMIYGNGIGRTFDGFVLKNNLMTGSYYGVYLFGVGNTYDGKFRNFVMDGNTLNNCYAYSTYTYYSSGLVFNKNIVNPSSIYTSNITYFMYPDTLTITNNIWNLTNNATMYLGYYSYNSAGRRGLVANNVITGTASVSAPTVYLGYFSQYIDFLNNSFSFPSTSQCAYIYNTSAVSYRLKNNVFHNRGTGSAIYLAAAPTNIEANYNNYFTTGSVLVSGVTSQTTMAGWKAYSNQDKNSLSFNPGFTSFTNLAPDPTSPNSWSLNGRAEYIATVPNDINGTARVANMADGVSDVGAYEFTPTSIPPTATAVPTTPTAGGTQSFLFGGDTIAKITYDAFATAPTSMAMRVYSGVKPLLIGTASAFPYFYVTAEAPTGTYTYTYALKYKPIWMGTLPTVADYRLAMKAPANAWMPLTGTNSELDSNNFTLTSMVNLSDLPAIFTAADNINPLPVELVKFTGTKVDVAASLNWATATERNSSHFEVERSYDASNFNTIGMVKSNGNSNKMVTYNFTDKGAFMNNEPVVFYRLKMVDMDGSFEYSNTVTINNQLEEVEVSEVKVFPNPFNSNFVIDYKSTENEVVELRDLSGRLVMSQTLNNDEMLHQITVPQNLDKGIYILNFTSNRTKSVKIVRD
jgi:hypothetical protein